MKRSIKQLLLILLFYILGIIIVLAAPLLMFWTTSQVAIQAGIYAIIIIASLLFLRILGLRISRGGFLAGPIAAIASMGLVFVVFLATGLVSVVAVRENWPLILLVGIVIQLLVAFGEELAFRAVIFRGLEINMGLWPAVALSSIAFALMHVPSMFSLSVGLMTIIVGLCTILVLGALLALLYKFGGLLNAAGFHFFWNWLEYSVFGLSSFGALKVSEPGAVIWTGGSFGPEASVITLTLAVAMTAALWYYYKKKGVAAAGTGKS